jgi:GntR family transcriptional regulator, transcriptional repressor for pyruvate dehydrogenase complex
VSVTDQAIEKIKEMILSGELGPGDRLPREADLAHRLGLSRNSLREAVRALSLIRILDVRQGDGTYVTSLDSSLLLDALSFVVDLHQDRSVLELLEARRVLEAEAAALAAQRITPAQIEELQRLTAAMPQCDAVQEFVDNDLRFHRTLAEASANGVIATLLDSLSGKTIRARLWRGITEAGAIDRTIYEHRAICDALARHRPDLARAWMAVHLASVEAWLELALEGEDSAEAIEAPGGVAEHGAALGGAQ